MEYQIESIAKAAGDTLPPFLYRYMYPKIQDCKDIIIESKIYFISPLKFNDPFDCRIAFDYSGSPRELKKQYVKNFTKTYKHLGKKKIDKLASECVLHKVHSEHTNFTNSILSKIGILSFSESNSNILLWSHYADKHRGLCFEFKSSNNSPFFGVSWPVQYKENYPLYKFVEIDREQIIPELLLIKSIDWKYEKEWRIIKHPSTNALGEIPGNGYHYFHHSELNGIIFGCRIDEAFKNQVIELSKLSKNELKLYQAQDRRTEFTVDITPL